MKLIITKDKYVTGYQFIDLNTKEILKTDKNIIGKFGKEYLIEDEKVIFSVLE